MTGCNARLSLIEDLIEHDDGEFHAAIAVLDFSTQSIVVFVPSNCNLRRSQTAVFINKL